jgi:hypothetical protein
LDVQVVYPIKVEAAHLQESPNSVLNPYGFVPAAWAAKQLEAAHVPAFWPEVATTLSADVVSCWIKRMIYSG